MQVVNYQALARASWLCAWVLLGVLTVAGQQRRGKPVAPALPTAATQEGFEKVAAAANSAREGERLDEAIPLFRQGVQMRPQWVEGWWSLASLLYDRDNYVEGARAFKEAARLQPKLGAPWAMLGLCEFQLARYDDALRHLQQGRRLGLGESVELPRVMRYHEGVISLLKGEYEKAQVTLSTLSYEGLNSEDLIIGLGLSVLRMGMLPKQVDVTYRDRAVVQRAGLAEHFNAQRNVSDAVREYDLLAKDFPTFPGAQYAYGRFLMSNRDEDGAVVAFQKEIQTSPQHALARMQIAYLKLNQKDAAAGLPYAEEGVKLHPRLPLGHYLLGRLLFDTGQTARAITELEEARNTAPTEPKIYFALIRAYSKANRKADAERAREIFTRLNQQTQAANSGEALPEDKPDKP